MGRRPLGHHAMSATERVRRHRAAKREAKPPEATVTDDYDPAKREAWNRKMAKLTAPVPEGEGEIDLKPTSGATPGAAPGPAGASAGPRQSLPPKPSPAPYAASHTAPSGSIRVTMIFSPDEIAHFRAKGYIPNDTDPAEPVRNLLWDWIEEKLAGAAA
jgi:hypothetical protein